MTSRSATPTIDVDRASSDAIAWFLAQVAFAAGPAVMEEYRREGVVRTKGDGSPVTLADQRAEAIICERLKAVAPPLPIVAEELTAEGAPVVAADRFFLVDPLDGTKEFIAHNGEFTVNVALVAAGAPIAGAVFAPALGRLWFGGQSAFVCEASVGAELGEPAQWRPICARAAPPAMVALASRSHLDPVTKEFLSRLPIGDRRSAGSSLKFCVLAEGEGDVYPRFAPTMEWDTAAADAVLRAAGGCVLSLDGAPLRYGKFESGLRNGGFVAWGDRAAAERFRIR